VATAMAPAASNKDSCPQAILKLHRPGSSLDYIACHGIMVYLFKKQPAFHHKLANGQFGLLSIVI